MKFLRIGEMARLNGVSIQTLRYYDEINLLNPHHIDEQTGYRYYVLSQSARLDMIQFLKSLDFSLEEIRLLIDNGDNEELIDYVLLKKSKEIDRKLKEMTIKREQIASFHKAYDCYVENAFDQSVHIQQLPPRYIYTYPINQNIYEMNILEYERYLREFKLHLKEHCPSYTHFFCRVGSLVRKENFIQKNFVSDILFVFLNEKPLTKEYEVLEEGLYAVCFCDCFDLELKHIHRLYAYLEQNGYEVKGDYVCEVVYEMATSHPENVPCLFVCKYLFTNKAFEFLKVL